MNKLALITGGSRGLGREAALNLAQQGVDVIFTYNTNRTAAEQTLKELEALGVKAATLELAVQNSEKFPAFVAEVQKLLSDKFQRQTLDILVNNAGIGAHAPIGKISPELFDQLSAIHLKAPIFLTQSLLPLMADGGRVINVSSGLARFTIPGYGVYSAMKGGVEVFTRYLAKELGPRGITANCIAPGAVDNDFNKASFDHNPQMKGILAAQTALGRVGESQDIGPVVAFLASSAAGWITGQILEVSGGMFL